MVIIRDEKRMVRMKKTSRWLSVVSMAILVAGLAMAFGNNPQYIYLQLIALPVGWALAQVAVYLAHRYGTDPRPDEVLDRIFKKAVPQSRLYHFILPAPHVALTPSGPIVLLPKYQSGVISAEGDKWKQKGIGMKRYFGQEALGNPHKEADAMVGALGNFLRKNAPDLEDVPIAVMVVFINDRAKELDLKKAAIPALHHKKVKGFLRQNKGEPLHKSVYLALRQVFDEAAGDLV